VIRISIDPKEKELEEIPEIKNYFIRIFTLLSKDVREKLNNLNLDKDQKKKIKKELAFLTKHRQLEYLDELGEFNNLNPN
jgi:hypothetical protein